MAVQLNNPLANIQAPAAAATDRPKAQYWLNVGMDSPVQTEDGSMDFISLPVGIALDTMQELPVKSSNQIFNQFQAARNDLLKQLIEIGATLQPGESAEIALKVQLRRVAEAPAVPDASSNPFAVKLVEQSA